MRGDCRLGTEIRPPGEHGVRMSGVGRRETELPGACVEDAGGRERRGKGWLDQGQFRRMVPFSVFSVSTPTMPKGNPTAR